MNFLRHLSASTIRLSLSAKDKRGVIEEMLDVLVATGRVRDREQALTDLLEREARMSTGMQHGLAIPHAKTAAVDGLLAAMGISPEGVDFASLDGDPSRIFVMTLSPLHRTGPHIQFLAEIGRLLSRPELRTAVLAASTPAEVITRLAGVGR